MFGVCLCRRKILIKVLQRTYGCLRLTFSGYKFKLELCGIFCKNKKCKETETVSAGREEMTEVWN